MYAEEDFLLLSGIQHFAFCRRQWALIYVEHQWQENLLTIEGMFLHEKAHNASSEKRGDTIITRSMPVFSAMLGIHGVCDVVELRRDDKGVYLHGRKGKYLPVPIEYKRGKPKENDADELQLCAQAMCLEDMLMCHIPHGYIFYGETRRRHEVLFDPELRKHVGEMLEEMHATFQRGYTPKVRPGKFCKACSLVDLCLPKLGKNISASVYLQTRLEEETEE